MKIQISDSRLFNTIALAYVPCGLIAFLLGATTCALNGNIVLRPESHLPFGLILFATPEPLHGIKGASIWFMMCSIATLLYTASTWFFLRLGLWMAGHIPGITIDRR